MACAKSAEARLRGGGRWWRRKAATFERGDWAAGGEAGVEASGQPGACGWRAAWGRAGWRDRVREMRAVDGTTPRRVIKNEKNFRRLHSFTPHGCRWIPHVEGVGQTTRESSSRCYRYGTDVAEKFPLT